MEREYTAFISYRHLPLDMAVAKKLSKLIERYRIPKDLRKNGEKHLGFVFRDQDELSVSSNLTEKIYKALDNSQYLIVICTPDTPKSMWVQQEIEYFISRHGRDRVLTVLAAGSTGESIPKLVNTIYAEDGKTILEQIEPRCAYLAADDQRQVMRKLKEEYLRIVSAILGCPYDSLKQRQKHYRAMQALAMLGAVAAIAILVITLLVGWNLDIAAKNEEISQMNEQIKEQYRQSQLNESQALSLLSANQLADGNRRGAIESALNALTSEDGERPYYVDAEVALANALNVYREEAFYLDTSIQVTTYIEAIATSDDGSLAVIMERNKGASCYDLATGQVLWTSSDFDEFSERSRISSDGSRFIGLEDNRAVVVSMGTGETLFTIDFGADDHNFRVISPDGKTLVVDSRVSLGYSSEERRYLSQTDVIFYDLSTGQERMRVPIDEEVRYSSFSQDGSTLLLSCYDDGIYTPYDHARTFLINCSTGAVMEAELLGACIESCPLPGGGFWVLTAYEAEDVFRTYTYYEISNDGEVIQLLPANSGSASDVVTLLADENWIYCIGNSSLQIRYQKDGTVLEELELPEMAMGSYPDIGYDERSIQAFLDRSERLIIACYDSKIYSYYPTQDFLPDTSIYGNPIDYRDSEGNSIPVSWNREEVYADALAFSDTFSNSTGSTIAMMAEEDSTQALFLRMYGDNNAVPASDIVLDQLLAEDTDPYVRYDSEEKILYWGSSEETAQTAQCPYPDLQPNTEFVTFQLYSGRSGLFAVPNQERLADKLALYSSPDDQWRWLDYPDGPITVGDSQKWVAMISGKNCLQVYDFDYDTFVFNEIMPVEEISGILFICQDKYLLMESYYDSNLILVDTETWEIVAEYDHTLSVYSDDFDNTTAIVSPDGRRLYIGNLDCVNYGLVIDMETLTLLAKVPYMAMYDKSANTLLCNDPSQGGWIRWPVYSTEKLIEMAKESLYPTDE